jgi:hypothetical protein
MATTKEIEWQLIKTFNSKVTQWASADSAPGVAARCNLVQGDSAQAVSGLNKLLEHGKTSVLEQQNFGTKYSKILEQNIYKSLRLLVAKH